jgi:hypothetical protein
MSNDEPMTATIVWLFSVVLGVVRPSYARNHGMPPGRHCIFSPTSARLQCNPTKCLTAKGCLQMPAPWRLGRPRQTDLREIVGRFSILPRPAASGESSSETLRPLRRCTQDASYDMQHRRTLLEFDSYI